MGGKIQNTYHVPLPFPSAPGSRTDEQNATEPNDQESQAALSET